MMVLRLSLSRSIWWLMPSIFFAGLLPSRHTAPRWRLPAWAFHDLPDALALCDLQLLVEIGQHRRQIVGRLLRFRHLIVLALQLLVELFQHGGRTVRQLPHIALQQLVQPVNADMVARAAFQTATVIRPAGVCGGQIAAAHGEQRAAAVATLQKPEYTLSLILTPR